MEIKDLFMWASLISSPILSTIAIIGHLNRWASKGEEALAAKQKAHETKLIDLDRRVQSVESELEHVPSKEMVFDLKLAITELRGNVSTLGESVASISRTVHRIDDYLREEAK